MTEIQEGSKVARVNYRGLYPRGAVEGAIDALELAFSYIRDQGNHICERRIEDALHYLRRAKEINEPRVNIRFLAADDEGSAVSNLVAAARVVNDELSHGEWSERSRARLNNALIDVAALSSEDATRPTPSTERPLMPSVPAGEGFFAAEGDERCGRVHVAARARCLMPKGHTGNHANTQGYWLDTEAADGWPEDATRPTGDKE